MIKFTTTSLLAALSLATAAILSTGTLQAHAGIKTCYVKPVKGSSGGHLTQRGARAAAWGSWQSAARTRHNRRMPYRSAITVNGYPKTSKNNRRWSATIVAYPCFPSGAISGFGGCTEMRSRQQAIANGCDSYVLE